MRILVTGASGFVGRHLVASLRRDGKSVTILARGETPSGNPDRFAGPVDLDDLDTWPDWPEDIDAVVHLAALNPSRRQPAPEEVLRRVNADGTAALARRARRESVRRIVFVSTSNVHATGPERIRESDLISPQSMYANSKAEAEVAFRLALEGGGTQGCILRPAPVYGPGGRGNVAALAKLARLPFPLPIGGLGGVRSLLAVDRLVDAITLCLTAHGAAGETFLVADRQAQRVADIVRAIRRGSHRTQGVFALPGSIRRRLEPTIRYRGGLDDFVIDPSHLESRTGWRPAASTTALLTGMAERGEI